MEKKKIIHLRTIPIRTWLKHHALLIGIIVMALVLRVCFLQSVPAGISDDELEFILNAKAIFYTGKDITQTWNPIANGFKDNIFPIVPYIFNLPIVGPLPFNILIDKLPYICFHLVLILTLYTIIKQLVNKKAALFVAFIATINPWMIFFGRTAFESPLSITFYLLGLYLLLQKNKWAPVFSLCCYIIAFFTYTGAKVLFIPYIFLTLVFTWFTNKDAHKIWQYAAIAIISLVLFASQLFALRTQAIGSRISEIITPGSSHIANTVNTERKLTMPFRFTNMFSNKYTAYGRYIIGKYFEVYSPTFLFQTGESRATYSLFNHGYFYYLDILFLFLGLSYLFRTKKTFFLFITACLFIAPLPAVINTGESGFAALRASLLFPIFCLLIGLGFYSITLHKKLTIIIFILYAVFLIRFLFVYFLQYPIYASEAYGFSRKVLSSYMERYQQHSLPITVFTSTPNSVLKQYLFTNNSYTKDNAKSVATLMKLPTYSFQTIQFASCLDPNPQLPTHPYIIETGLCEKYMKPHTAKHLSISILSDGGEVYKIYNDTLCSEYKLGRYPEKITLRVLQVSNLSNEDFCQQLIFNVN